MTRELACCSRAVLDDVLTFSRLFLSYFTFLNTKQKLFDAALTFNLVFRFIHHAQTGISKKNIL